MKYFVVRVVLEWNRVVLEWYFVVQVSTGVVLCSTS